MPKKITFGVPGYDNDDGGQREVLADALLQKLDFCHQVEYGEMTTVVDSDAGYPKLLHIYLYCTDEAYDEALVNQAYGQVAQKFNTADASVKLEVTDLHAAAFE